MFKATYIFGLLLTLLFKLSFIIVEATFDMNLKQLQYVADHITEKECRKLSEALTMNGVILEHEVTGAEEKDLSCLRLLLLWDRGDNGRATSFVDLAIKLRQIGRPEVADVISQMVYDEKADQVQHEFLDNPFKDMINTDSPLLAKPPQLGTSGDENVPKSTLSKLQWIGIIGGSTLLLIVIVCCYGRRTDWKMCRRCKAFGADVAKVARHPTKSLHLDRSRTEHAGKKRSSSSKLGKLKKKRRVHGRTRKSHSTNSASSKDYETMSDTLRSVTPSTAVPDDVSVYSSRLLLAREQHYV